MINQGDNLKVKHAYEQNQATFWQKKFPVNFCLGPIIFFAKRIKTSTSCGFCVIALQIYKEVIKKYRKKAITLQITNFSKIGEN